MSEEHEVIAIKPVESSTVAPSTNRIFALFVDQLVADEQDMEEALIVRLRWFGEDIAKAAERIGQEPAATLEVVKGLSSIMQDLDAAAGSTEAKREGVAAARRWALLIPESGVHD